jgi:DNA invertase Pin-like site-specific DNA recombinase
MQGVAKWLLRPECSAFDLCAFSFRVAYAHNPMVFTKSQLNLLRIAGFRSYAMVYMQRILTQQKERTIATILYARISTSDQTISHQRTLAEQAGFKIDCVIDDEGVSGVTVPLKERNGGKRLFDKLRAGDTLVVRWVDRLGRNYEDVTTNIREFMEMGVTIKTVINKMTFDGATNDPMQKAIRDAMIAFMAANAQAQAEAQKLAAKAGHEHRKAMGDDAYKGRKPSYTTEQIDQIVAKVSEGVGVNEIARQVGLSKFAVSRIKSDTAGAYAKAQRWGI